MVLPGLGKVRWNDRRRDDGGTRSLPSLNRTQCLSERATGRISDAQGHSYLLRENVQSWSVTNSDAFHQHLTATQGSKSHRLIAQQLTMLARHFNVQQHLHQVQDHDLHRLMLKFRDMGLADETIRLYLSRIRDVVKNAERLKLKRLYPQIQT